MSNTLIATKAFRSSLIQWFRQYGKPYPWRFTKDPYAILVSEIMLQQTQVATLANKNYYENWLKKFPNIQKLSEASEEAILKEWEGLGYYNRARNLQKCAKEIIEKHQGIFPQEMDSLLSLSGIGLYTAGAVLSFAYNLPLSIVDANIARILARLHNFEERIDNRKGEEKIWNWAEELLDKKNSRIYNSALIELGQNICLPRQPLCEKCPISSFCRAENPAEIPHKKKKPSITPLKENVIFSLNKKGILLSQNKEKRRKNFWQLPLWKKRENQNLKLIDKFQYSITRYRVNVFVYEKEKLNPSNNEKRFSLKTLNQIPISSPYRKFLNRKLEIDS